MFVQLYTKSVYSILNSSLTIRNYVQKGKEYGLQALALCDEGNVYGLIKFYRACQEANIHPILGLTLLLKECVLVVYAKDNTGYRQLLKLASLAQLEEELTIQTVKPHLTHVITILPILNTPLEHHIETQHMDPFKSIVEEFRTDDLFIGLPIFHHPLSRTIREWAKQLQVPLVYFHEVQALDPIGVETLHYLWAIRDGTSVRYQEIPSFNQRYFIDPNTLVLDQADEAYQNMAYIAHSCQVTIDFNTFHFPQYPTPKGISSFEYLKVLCMKGLEKRLGKKRNELPQDYTHRLKYELQVIERMNYSDYFLVVYDYVKYAKKQGILVGPGRGSAAGSLVAYVLGITNVDPIQYNLLFERFLNPERVSLPDIDIDFEDVERDRVIKYVQKKYGKDHVAHIVTFGTFAARSAVREVAKTMGVNSTRIAEITSKLNGMLTIRENIERNEELQKLMADFSDIRRIFEIAERIEGIPRNTSTHAAGIVISGEPLMHFTALSLGLNGVYQTQYEAEDLELLGLVKMDLLGLRNLTMIHRMLDLIEIKEGKRLDLSRLPFDDQQTFQLLSQGETTGVFQLESDGMRRVLRQMGVNRFEDIVAVNALYRPGPADNIPTFIRRKRGLEPVSYVHPSLQPLLESTYGIIVYQEQIMQIAQVVANYSLGRADLLRRAIGKKQRDFLEKEREIFRQGAIQNGYSSDVAETLFDYIVRFGDYGFNRSHSVAYSMISYYLAYLKAHYPTEFMCVLLSSVVSSESQTKRYIQEARRYRIEVLPVSINRSHNLYRIENNKSIRMGFLAIKGLGHNTVNQLIAERKKGPYRSYVDFIQRTRSFLKQNVLRALIFSGALDEFGLTKKAMVDNYNDIINFLRFNPSGYFDEQLTLSHAEEYTLAERLRQEQNLLGFCLHSHPLRTVIRESDRDFKVPSELSEIDEVVTVVGLVNHVKEFVTRHGDPMLRFTLSDDLVQVDAVVFPRQYRYITEQLRQTIENQQLVKVEGKINGKKGHFEVIVQTVSTFEP